MINNLRKNLGFRKQIFLACYVVYSGLFFFSFNNRVIFSAEICLLMVLYRFAFPSTLNKLEIMVGRSSSSCSRIVTHGVSLIYARFGTRLYEFDIQLVLQRIHLYQEAVSRKSKSAVETCFGFLDGTVHYTTRPRPTNTNNIQRACYNGHKRHHRLKFQSLVVPDGMIAQMFGPVEGRRHDCSMLKFSN